MKLRCTILLVLIFLNGAAIYSQNSIFGSFLNTESVQSSIDGATVLSDLNWPALKLYCDSTGGYYARKKEEGSITTYNYTKQGYTENFSLTLFNDKVLEYKSHVDELFKTNYFNKKVWIEYVKSEKQFQDLEWMLTEEELKVNSSEVIQAYITLLGFNVRDEYGWICEYSAAGFPPKKRLAIVGLIKHGRRDFIVRLLNHSNLQTQLYAADALIYLDIIGDIQIVQMETFKGTKKKRKYYIKKSNQNRLSQSERRKIGKLKSDNQYVITCGNMGSYKQYKVSTSELLSADAISMIYTNYLLLKDYGYY